MEENAPWTGEDRFPQAVQAPTNTLATWSLVLGILSFVCAGVFGAVAAVVLGHMALGQIRRSEGAEGGGQLAVVGLVLGYANIALTVLAMIAVAAFFVLSVAAAGRQVEMRAKEAAFEREREAAVKERFEREEFSSERPIVADDDEGIRVARRTLEVIAEALEAYRADMGEYPPDSRGLDALVSRPGRAKAWRGPYLASAQFDPWGNAYVYGNLGSSYDIHSLGPDGEESEDDVYPE